MAEGNPDRRAATTPDPEAVVSKAAIRAADHLGLKQQALGRVLGLSNATVTRLKVGRSSLPQGSKPYELALLLIRLFRGLEAMMGGDPRRCDPGWGRRTWRWAACRAR